MEKSPHKEEETPEQAEQRYEEEYIRLAKIFHETRRKYGRNSFFAREYQRELIELRDHYLQEMAAQQERDRTP